MRNRQLTHSLRFRITAGIALPLLVILGAFSYLQYIQQRDLLLSNLDSTTSNLGNVIVGSLEHAMLSQDLPEIQGIMENIGKQQGIREVFLINREGQVRFASRQDELGRRFTRADTGCVECHGGTVTPHPFSITFINAQGERIFRNCKPIANQTTCQGCHDPAISYNGVLVTDLSMQPVEELLAADLRTYLLWSSAAIVTTILAVNALMSRMVVTRLERLVRAIQQFSHGDLSNPVHTKNEDEISELGKSLNQMARQVLDHTRELERLNEELRHKETLRGQLLIKLITAQEEERKRIARELHDQLGQALSALTMGMEAVEHALPPSQDALRERLARAKALATDSLEQTHEMILDLRPVALDDLGLVAAVRQYAEQHLGQRGIEVQVSQSGSARRLKPELEIALFRIVQEAINNIAHHANAQHVWLDFAFGEAHVQVSVRDDGCGFDPMQALNQSGHGFGLLGMQERATLADGTVRVESKPGDGTRVVITLPAVD